MSGIERIPVTTNLKAYHNGVFNYRLTLSRESTRADDLYQWCKETVGEPLLQLSDDGDEYVSQQGARWDGVSNMHVFVLFFMEARDAIQCKMVFDGVMEPTGKVSDDG